MLKNKKIKQKEKEQESAANKKQTETYSQIAKQAVEIATKPIYKQVLMHHRRKCTS